MKSFERAFSLVELIIVVVVLTILSGTAYLGYSSIITYTKNERVKSDLLAISSALEQYYKDHEKKFPIPQAGGSMNVLCLEADISYAHDCMSAAFRQGMLDESLLTKRYLGEIPVDPRNGARYVYGVTNDGKYYQVAAVIEAKEGWIAKTVGNTDKGFFLPSLIRAYDSPRFVVNDGTNLPYSPDHLTISARLRNIRGAVSVSGGKTLSDTLYPGDIITTGSDGSVDIFWSDGSVTRMDPESELEIREESAVEENDEDNIATKIYLKLIRGKIWNKVVRLAEKSEFNVETTSAIAGVRGTEFGVWADNTLVVYSGEIWVAENSDAAAVTGVPGAPVKAVMTETGPTGVAEVTDSILLEYIKDHHTPLELSESDIPFIVGVTGRSSGQHDIFVSFNGKITEEIYSIDGFEVFGLSQLGNGWSARNDIPAPDYTTSDVTYDTEKKAYRFTMDFSDGGPLGSEEADGLPRQFILRAFKSANGGEPYYSALSWRPEGVLGMPENEEYREVAEELDFPETSCTENETDSQSCPIGNGTGLQSYLCVSNEWHTDGVCTVVSCDTGYVPDVNSTSCVPDSSTLADVCEDGGGYPDGDYCWILGAAGASCDTACEDFGTDNDVTASVICNPDTTWNDDASSSICVALTGGTPAGTNPSDYAPFWLDTGTVQQCTPRGTGTASCTATPPVITGLTFRRLCSCTE